MGSKWKKVKMALGPNLCLYVPRNHVNDNDHEGDSPSPSHPPSERRSDVALLSPPVVRTSAQPSSSSNKLITSRSLSRSSSKKTCSICLASIKQGNHAIFTSECSHMFHFKCIVSNVKHGNEICPVCRAKWKEIPVQYPILDPPNGRARICPVDWLHNNDRMTENYRHLPTRLNGNRHATPLLQNPEPSVFNDDESLDCGTTSTERNVSNNSSSNSDAQRKVKVDIYTEVSSIPRSKTVDSFTTLLQIKAPSSNSWHNFGRNNLKVPQISRTPYVPVDLVTVLDISGSMAGTKLALIKRAMGFVIQNLGPNDRLSVIAFSSSARRVFPLFRMSASGRRLASQAVNSLVASGGTNIAEGLRKGAKTMEDRREKNPVASIILLSDGQDTYTINSSGGNQNPPNYQLLLPSSIRPEQSLGVKIPIHAFGFGSDHDPSLLHSISETSGGTFSFIETVGAIQDAFAQCIGGLLSVLVTNLEVRIECIHPIVGLVSIEAGSYPSHIKPNKRSGSIDIGDLYADEGRDFLVSVNVPLEVSKEETVLLNIKCVYSDPLTKEWVTLDNEEVKIKRTEVDGQEKASIEVDRQQNRFRAADAMSQAQTAAEHGDLTGAISILESCRNFLSETISAKCHDNLSVTLDAELKEMRERMSNRRVYIESGRAYILSGLSSHSWQRATTRGDSIDGSSSQSYQTPSMVEMIARSQETLRGGGLAQKHPQPLWSFVLQPKPR